MVRQMVSRAIRKHYTPPGAARVARDAWRRPSRAQAAPRQAWRVWKLADPAVSARLLSEF